MLLPALGQAREKARTTSCISNIRQLGMAMIQYTMDNEDFFPPFYVGEWGKSPMWLQPTYKYVGSPKALYCPHDLSSPYAPGGIYSIARFNYDNSNYADSWVFAMYDRGTSYGLNCGDFVKYGIVGQKAARIRKSSSAIMFGEASYIGKSAVRAGNVPDDANRPCASMRKDEYAGTPYPKHRQTFNWGAVDGHVEGIQCHVPGSAGAVELLDQLLTEDHWNKIQ